MKNTIAFIFLGIIALLPAGLAGFLLHYIFSRSFGFPGQWLVLTFWLILILLVLFATWIIKNSFLKLHEMINHQQLEQKKLEQEQKLSEGHIKYRIETEKNENLLRLIDRLSDKIETTKKKENEETKTVTLSFRKELIEEVKAIKLKWDEVKKDIAPVPKKTEEP